jgi:hypothetical protein
MEQIRVGKRSKEAGPSTFTILRILGLIVALSSGAYPTPKSGEQTKSQMMRELLKAHEANFKKLEWVEGETMLTLYTHWPPRSSAEVGEVTRIVRVSYAWNKAQSKRWTEYRVLRCVTTESPAPRGPAGCVSSRDLVDLAKHIRVTGDRILSPAKVDVPLAVRISPLRNEPEALIGARNSGAKVGLAYNCFGRDFDIRFYFSKGGQDLDDLLRMRIDAFEELPESLDHVTMDKIVVGDMELIEMGGTFESAGVVREFVSRFDLARGGNPVFVSRHENGQEVWRSSHEYYYDVRSELWFPSFAHILVWNIDASGRRYLHRELLVEFSINTRINQPWSRPDIFEIEGLGLRKGDLVMDEMAGKRYRYREELESDTASE